MILDMNNRLNSECLELVKRFYIGSFNKVNGTNLRRSPLFIRSYYVPSQFGSFGHWLEWMSLRDLFFRVEVGIVHIKYEIN